MGKYKYVCAECGSDKVLLDSFVAWNIETQEFEIDNIFEKGHFCSECDGECKVESEPIEDQEVKAKEIVSDKTCISCDFWGVDFDGACDFPNTVMASKNIASMVALEATAHDDQGLSVKMITGPSFGCVHHSKC